MSSLRRQGIRQVFKQNWANLGLILFYLGIFLLWPKDAFAWGPAVHINLALKILLELGALSPPLRKLLQRYPNDFVYGNISADIILGKKFIDYYYHCHNWRVGLEILNHAKTDSQIAFAYGYLCHLAADVIAHNLFIPDKMVQTYHTFSARHAYWEVRYDLRFDPEILHRGHRIAQTYHEKNDVLLEEVLRETLFSFKTNKKIFDGLLRLQKHERAQQLMKKVTERSRLPWEESKAEFYNNLNEKSVRSVLDHLEKSDSFKADPAGHLKLDIAKDLRKQLKKLRGEGTIHDREIEQVITNFRDILNQTLFLPEQCPNAEDILTTSF